MNEGKILAVGSRDVKTSLRIIYILDAVDEERLKVIQKILTKVHLKLKTRDGSRFSNIQIFYLIIEYRLGCAIIF